MKNKIIKVKKLNLGNNLPLTLIAGPCQIESKDHCHMIASKIKDITSKLNIGFIFKSSFDKANRTSIKSKRGAFLCRQTDLLVAAAKTNKVVNVKKGQFLAPWDMKNVIKKIEESGNDKILITERGVSFGYNTLVSDMRSLSILADFGYPVVFDATHSVQQPGGKGDSSGGERQFVSSLSRAAVAVGVSTIFLETHDSPDKAPSDGANMIPLSSLESLLKDLIGIDKLIKSK